jgi:hypothetical protein
MNQESRQPWKFYRYLEHILNVCAEALRVFGSMYRFVILNLNPKEKGRGVKMVHSLAFLRSSIRLLHSSGFILTVTSARLPKVLNFSDMPLSEYRSTSIASGGYVSSLS